MILSSQHLNTQVGGSHYQRLPMQPIELITGGELPFCVGNAVKYMARWRDKNGVEDLRKVVHYLDLHTDLESPVVCPTRQTECRKAFTEFQVINAGHIADADLTTIGMLCEIACGHGKMVDYVKNRVSNLIATELLSCE